MTLTILVCVHSTNSFYDSLICRALDSLEIQTFKKFDVLVILDECWDKTIDTLIKKKYGFDLKIIEKPKKTGLFDAKNFGLSFIKSDLVAFLDGDDYYLPNKLEKQINFLENNKVDFLGCHSWNTTKNNDSLFPSCFDVKYYVTHEQIQEKIYSENVLTHGSMIIKKKCLEKLGGYRNVMGEEDWDLWKRAFDQGFKFYQLPERLYVLTLGTSVPR